MKALWLFLVLPAVLGQISFGRSYLKNSRLCHQWNCINTKLGLPDDLPPRNQTEATLKRVLPSGVWQDVLGTVLDKCYENRTKRYTNTCPGQALLHCIVDNMVDNCPESSLRKDDACSPVSSLAGFKYMFSQSRYDNLEKNLPKERRPVWFLKHYFDQKCCDLPVMFNATVLQECGFNSFMTYYNHEPRFESVDGTSLLDPTPTPSPLVQSKREGVQVAHLTPRPDVDISNTDPLDCCDMNDFIQPAWRSECGFQLSWRGHERLVIANNTPVSTTTEMPSTTQSSADTPKDLMLVPQSCAAETCVFKNLDIITDSGSINTMAFMKLLDNFTDAHPSWKKAGARVVTKCLSRRVHEYDGECEINRILACTLDLLTENCPYKRKSDDPCKHNKHKTGCQISSSRLRPKNRRGICLLPPLVHQDYLTQCGIESLYKAEHVVVPDPKPPQNRWSIKPYFCQDLTPSTTCVMQKMQILNKYNFMGYFQMKDKIREFTTSQSEWAALLNIYISAFINMPMYKEHCNSQKKFLNVIDSMLMTCPVSKRVNSPQCTKIFQTMSETTPIDNQNVTKEKLDEIMKHYHHIFLPNQPLHTKHARVIRKNLPKVIKKPIFNYGLLNTHDTPKISVINIKPSIMTSLNKPLVLAPVYLRDPKLKIATPFHNDGVFRSNPYWLHERIASAHLSTPSPVLSSPSSMLSTSSSIIPTPSNRPLPSTTPKPLPTLPIDYENSYSPFGMMKPEFE